MKAIKKWRYYCDHCKKSGASSFHMAAHERSCTLNPLRSCKCCLRLNGSDGTPLPEMLALLPDPAAFMRQVPEEDFGEWLGSIPAHQEMDDEGLRTATHAALPALRELTEDCPVCILAALRQRGIPVPVVTAFNFSEEMKAAQMTMQDLRSER